MPDSRHLVCPACGSTNRIPEIRINDQPNCGKCHLPLFAGKPIDLTSEFFDRHIQRNDIPVLVDFWAPWCGPCKMMAPAYQKAAELLEPRVRVAKVDTESERDLGARYAIRSIPTLALFKDGREIARQAGAMGTADIVRWVESYLK